MSEQRWILGILLFLLGMGATIDRYVAAPKFLVLTADELELRYPEGFVRVPPSHYRGGVHQESTAGVSRDARENVRRELLQSAASPRMRIEIEVAPNPPYNNLPAALAVIRATRYGHTYFEEGRFVRNVGGRDWHVATFIYPFVTSEAGSPTIVRGIEYAAISGDRLYSVTLHGSHRETEELAAVVEDQLRLSDSGLF